MLDLLIITGASRGIGANIASQCNTNCAKTLITISSSGKIDHISDDYNNLIPLTLNLINHKEVYKKVKETIYFINNIEEIKSVGIILCGAQLGEPGGLLTSDLDNWNMLYNCNVLGNLAVVKGCEDIIKAGIKTRIIFFAGGGAAFGYPEFSGYSLSKCAVVRASENLGMELSNAGYDASVIAVAPGAVATDMLAKVIASGAEVRTKTDIKEPTNFAWNFVLDKFPSKELNGKFLHVRDDLSKINSTTDIFKLRRIQ